ncbi:MAG: hypothetical protein R3F59_06930 [Myxococcota bacterium]
MPEKLPSRDPAPPPDDRQPHVDYPQPADALEEAHDADLHSSRTNGSPPPPATPATRVTTRPVLVPEDGTDRTPPGPEAPDGPLSPSGTPRIKPS